MRRKMPLAAMYSAFMFPGFGQMINGQRLKGMVFVAGVLGPVSYAFVRLMSATLSVGPCPQSKGVIGCIWWDLVLVFKGGAHVVGLCALLVAVVYGIALADAWIVARKREKSGTSLGL